MHMRDGCLRLLRLGPDLVHKSPLHSETAFRTRHDALPNQLGALHPDNRWDMYYGRSRPFVKERPRLTRIYHEHGRFCVIVFVAELARVQKTAESALNSGEFSYTS